MPERLVNGEKVVGTRSLLRAIAEGSIRLAYIGADADIYITNKVETACRSANVPLIQVSSMAELGRLCKSPVPAASAGLKK
ncbi:MAG: ribosomal L7Ae/L30e/S12e/Gadd45 family protein [Clostridia bacterium]|nr:ribosomal L7Ae/L30e/S12e/Gadd45 family protein [Clostridia bacterium]